jgi:hypothetical protein
MDVSIAASKAHLAFHDSVQRVPHFQAVLRARGLDHVVTGADGLAEAELVEALAIEVNQTRLRVFDQLCFAAYQANLDIWVWWLVETNSFAYDTASDRHRNYFRPADERLILVDISGIVNTRGDADLHSS